MKLFPFQPHAWFGVSVVFAVVLDEYLVLQGSKRWRENKRWQFENDAWISIV